MLRIADGLLRAQRPHRDHDRVIGQAVGSPSPAPSPKSFAAKADVVVEQEARRTWGRGYY